MKSIGHYTQNKWVLQLHLLTHQFNWEALRNPLDTEVLKSKKPWEQLQEACVSNSGAELPSRENTIIGEHQGLLPTGKGGGREGRAVVSVLGQEQRLGDSNQAQPHSSQAWYQDSRTEPATRAWALTQSSQKKGKLQAFPSSASSSKHLHIIRALESSLGYLKNPRLISCWKLQIRVKWFNSAHNKPKPKHGHTNEPPLSSGRNKHHWVWS